MQNKKFIVVGVVIGCIIIFAPKAFASDRYYVGGTANWSATSSWATTSGGSPGASIPTPADNCFFDASSSPTSYTVTLTAAVSCKDITVVSPPSGNATIGVNNYNMAVYGSMDLATGTVVSIGTSGVSFAATSSVQTIRTRGTSFVIVSFTGSGATFRLLDNLTVSYQIGLSAGRIFDANGQTVIFPSSTNAYVSGDFTFYNLTRNTNAANRNLYLGGNITITGTLTLNGYSATTSRSLLVSQTSGAQTAGITRTITLSGASATLSVSNIDLEDIAGAVANGASAALWDLSAISGLSGDCGGNSGITFTNPQTQYYKHPGTANASWSGANWYASDHATLQRVPLPQDDVVFNVGAFAATGKKITMDMPRGGKSIDFSAVEYTPTFALDSTSNTIYGSLTLGTMGNSNIIAMGGNAFVFGGRSAYTLKSNGNTFSSAGNWSFTSNAPGGSLTLKDNLNMVGGTAVTLTTANGTFSAVDGANNYAITTGRIGVSASGTIALGSATHLLTGTGAVWTGTGIVNAGSSTLKFTNTGTSTISFTSGTKTYNNVWFSRGGSTASTTITGNNTFNDFKDDGNAAHSILFTHGTTSTVQTFTVTGNGAGNEITINSDTAATHSLVKLGGGTISSDYLNIQHSVASPVNTWYAGTNSINNQAVATAGSGWIFTSPPVPGAPGTPTYTSVSSSTLTVNWASSTGATYYKMERATSSQSYLQIATTSALSYADTGLTANTTFFYRVRGTNGNGDGPYSTSSSILTLPDVVSPAPTYANIGTSTVTVNWTTPTGGAASYIIQRATSSQSYAQVATTTAIFINDSGLAQSTIYFYRVQAANATGNGQVSASSSVTTTGVNSAPNAPSEDLPANNSQGISITPVFEMTATDPESNNLQYRVVIYSNSGCTAVVQTNDQSASQTGWSGQNASSSYEYISGTQGVFATQSALSANTTYYWIANAKDPEGSNTWGASSTCNGFTTAYGSWATDSGNWSVSSSQYLVVTPGSGLSVQIHVPGQSRTDAVVEFKVKSSAVGANTGNIASVARADSGANRYHLSMADFLNQKEAIGKTNSSAYSTLTSTAFTFSAGTFYEFRGSISGTTLSSWLNGGNALTITDSALTSAGYLGFAASSTNGSVTFTIDNFALYSSTGVTMNSLPGGGSWTVRTSASTTISCQTGSTWDLSTYTGQVPIDYDNGGGSVAVWAGNNSCSGAPDVTYPAAGLATDIFGGDTYAYTPVGSTTSQRGASIATSTITVGTAGVISY
jgi:hypothetical protein